MTDPTSDRRTPIRGIRETRSHVPDALCHPEWRDAFPWLVQGTTARAEGSARDFGLYSDASTPVSVLESWTSLLGATSMATAVYARQVHGAAVRFHRRGTPGLVVAEPCDGHATADASVLLAVTTADCVPVSVVDAERRAVAMLHAGWRGIAAGVLERGLAVLGERTGAPVDDLWVHMGPSICGRCYEVGPEVFEALGLPVPGAAAPVDLGAALAGRALAAGVPAERLTRSLHCTLCGDVGLFSHRGGERRRQVGFLGIRSA